MKFTSVIKLTAMAIWTIISVLLAFVGILLTFNSKSAIWVAHHVWTPILLLVLGAKLKVTGLEYIDKSKHYIILANHTSNLDIPMLTAGLPIPFYYVAKKEMRKIPFLGWIMWAAGLIFIDRGNKEKAIKSLRQAGKKIKNGKSVMIFPEGTFDETPGLLPFKKGPFHLARHADTEILPVAIVNAAQVWPVHSSLALKRGQVELRIGKPISTHHMTEHDIESVLLETQRSIEGLMK